MTEPTPTAAASESFDHSLQIALEKIRRPDWWDPLQALVTQFDGLPDYDAINIRGELLNLLWGLAEATAEDTELPVESLMAIRLAKLECWTLRASKPISAQAGGPHQKTWNPIEESYHSFRGESTLVQISQANSAYPAEDIIKRWARERLR